MNTIGMTIGIEVGSCHDDNCSVWSSPLFFSGVAMVLPIHFELELHMITDTSIQVYICVCVCFLLCELCCICRYRFKLVLFS